MHAARRRPPHLPVLALAAARRAAFSADFAWRLSFLFARRMRLRSSLPRGAPLPSPLAGVPAAVAAAVAAFFCFLFYFFFL